MGSWRVGASGGVTTSRERQAKPQRRSTLAVEKRGVNLSNAGAGEPPSSCRRRDLYVDTLACELANHLVREHMTECAGTVWSTARLSPRKLRGAVEYIDDNLRSN